MLSKRILTILSVLLIASLALAACAPSGADTTEPAATTAPETTPEMTEEPTEEATPEMTEEPTEEATPEMTEEATEPPAAGEPDVCATDEFGCAVLPAGETVKIGMGAPMTGDNAAFGTDISQAAALALRDAGEVEGFSFELVAEDDGGTPEGGAAVANRLASDETVVAVAGHIFSGATAAAIPIYEEAGIPMMSPSATNPDLTAQGSRVFNRLVFTDAAQGQFAADYLYNTLGVTNVAVLHDGSAYGQGLAEVVEDEFAALGGTVAIFQGIETGQGEYNAVLADIASLAPEAIYFGGYTGDAVVLVNGMQTQGLQDAIFFGADGIWGVDFLERTGENGEGVYAASLVPPATDARIAFDEAYLAEYGIEAGKLSAYTYTGYDSGAVLAEAVKSVAILGGDGNLYVPRGALVEAVRTVSDYTGLSGGVACDEVGECSSSGPTFYVIQDGAWVEAQ
jgi:branched-chain amino acid transport system substrate-binding protein